jgi:mannose-6-phosphate isomerase-like protein (cupin superfamily)
MFLIIAGTVEMTISGKTTRLGPGSAAFVASNEEHGLRNAGSGPAQYFVVTLGSKAE